MCPRDVRNRNSKLQFCYNVAVRMLQEELLYKGSKNTLRNKFPFSIFVLLYENYDVTKTLNLKPFCS